MDTEELFNETAYYPPEGKQSFALMTSKSKNFKVKNSAHESLPCENYLKATTELWSSSETCFPTEFQKMQMEYFDQLATDPLAETSYNFYRNLSFVGSIIDDSPQYFGPNGEYTKLVQKRTRDLRRFWNLDRDIQVHGQHNETLNDREKLADILLYFVEDIENREQIYPYVDDLLLRNQMSPYLPESPLFSIDGFSTFGGVIVVGDGLVNILGEAGIDPEVAWSGILAHEWAHQVQMELHKNNSVAFPEPEADFLAAYYLTHKRGATYNWKKTEEFLDLFFQLGACSDQNHGDPQMRMLAAYSGYELAMETQKKGHILNPETLNIIFREQFGNEPFGEMINS